MVVNKGKPRREAAGNIIVSLETSIPSRSIPASASNSAKLHQIRGPYPYNQMSKQTQETMATQANLLQLLDRAAERDSSNGICVYTSEGKTDYAPTSHVSRYLVQLSYKDLRRAVKEDSKAVRGLLQLHHNNIVLLHVDNHLDGIHWFWSIVAAGGIPCMSSPFSKDNKHRIRHIKTLRKLLGNPTVITNEKIVNEFDGTNILRLWTFGQIKQSRDTLIDYAANFSPRPASSVQRSDTAVLMLTSGSTGDAKAVRLTHKQILASVKGKRRIHHTSSSDVFLNWTGLDHVANLVEIHIHAMSLCANQIHLSGAEVLHYPMGFLEMIHQHRVSYTFAPNFFLGILDSLVPEPVQGKLPLDLSCLRALISGGEANVVQTCANLTKLLQNYKAPDNFIRPGFGMTETCAGSTYNAIDCPAYDVEQLSEFASLGKPIRGCQIRIVRRDGSASDQGEIGELQVSGKVIFPGYYNNREETEKVFTADGWFRTGDTGMIDANGRLCLSGREKDLVIVNGLNFQPQGIESAIQEAHILGVTSTYTVVFGHRPLGSHTEVIVVVYLPTYEVADALIRGETATAISKVVVTFCGVRPQNIIPLEPSLLQKTTLGKLSRPKIRKAYEEGQYDYFILIDQIIMNSYNEQQSVPPATESEIALVKICRELFGASTAKIGINDNLLTLGVSSINLLTLKMHVQKRLNISVPITYFFSNPVLRDLARSIADLLPKTTCTILKSQPDLASAYDPVVVLISNPGSTKTPIWFIHPGMGDILIFMNLSRYITDRPVYALRARGFDTSDGGYYTSISEIIQSYFAGVKRVQPHGPYALLGYSFGSILTFEITKILEASGEEVRFLGTLDQPPRFKERARTYDWYECAMTVAFFLGLIGEDFAYESLPAMRKLTQEQVLDHVFELAPAGRCEELCMTREKLNNWAELAWKLKVAARDYDPEGMVKRMDVFYTGPLVGLVKAKTTEEWRRDFIGMWDEFVGDVRYYEVKGTHRTLISPPYLVRFWKVLKGVMEDRGL